MSNAVSSKITGKEYPLSKIFSSDFEYHIPGYQRPYSWTKEETGLLFDDLYNFFQEEKSDNYFLGSIVLIKEEQKRYAEVIDGQQRLTTLSILFSAMADAFGDSECKSDCKAYLCEKGKALEGIEAKPRVFLRDADHPFFYKYIQNVQLDALVALDPVTLDTEAKKHIRENCALLREKLKDIFLDDKQRLEFTQFLLTRCYLVVVSTPSQESAFRIFTVMNSRGLDLLPTDIIKSTVIGNLPKEKQQEYTEKWEGLEELTGRDGFNEVFTHTRTIFVKERQKKTLREEFEEYILKTVSPKRLIDDYLVPYTNAYVQLKNCEFTATHHADEVNGLLFWLNKTNNSDWMPPAIKFLAEHPNDSEYVLWFIRKLERLASYLLVTAQDVNHRVDRYKWLLVEMEGRPDSTLTSPLRNIELTDWEKEHFRQTLDGEIYTMTAQRRNYIIQRLDSFMSDGGASYNQKLFTIEHVLPQHPPVHGSWPELWPDEQERMYWLNRIANLVPLTRQRNSAAQNYGFTTKKEKYFQSKGGTSSYVLTTQVINEPKWTPDVVKKRQETLNEVFAEKWELSPSRQSETDEGLFLLAGRGSSAMGYPIDKDCFLVLKGSRIAPDVTSGLPQNYVEQRKTLLEIGIVQSNVFTEDHVFTSASAAASIILGRSSNGRREWAKLDGRTLAQSGH
jgi:hypothetical protein